MPTTATRDRRAATGRHGRRRRRGGFPAYGPVDAVLGLWLFVVVVDRLTPPIVAVARDVLPGVSSSLVTTALALFVWFVIVVTVLEQLRRQLAALGLGRAERRWWRHGRRGPPSLLAVVWYLLVLVVAGVVAGWTVESALATAAALVPAVAAIDVGAILTWRLVTMVVFFVAFSVATKALDRLVVGAFRAGIRLL
jgi:hypothetical protein